MNTKEENNNPVVEGEILLFRELWNNSSDNMFIIKRTKDGEYINEKTNRSLKEKLGLDAFDIDGISMKKFLSPKAYEDICSKYDKCISLKKTISYEELHILNNKKRYWNTMILPVYDEENDFYRIFGISREITEIKEMNQELESVKEFSLRDNLTKLHNRYFLDECLENAIDLKNRYDSSYGLIILDIDNFKNINDTYGHDVGDLVLKDFANILLDSIRHNDNLGRWGGEEFIIILPFVYEESLLSYAEKIRKSVESHDFAIVGKLTASFGVTITKKNDNFKKFFKRADEALFQAKRDGRNRVCIK